MPKTPSYKKAAGGGLLENNKDVIFYGPGENQAQWNRFFGEPGMDLKPSDYLFVFFEDNVSHPNENSKPRDLLAIDDENVFQIFAYTPTKKLDDGQKHQVLGIRWDNANYKLKRAGAFSEGGKSRPYFYVQSYPADPFTGEPTKYWGTILRNQPGDGSGFGKKRVKKSKRTTLSKVSNDIRYLSK